MISTVEYSVSKIKLGRRVSILVDRGVDYHSMEGLVEIKSSLKMSFNLFKSIKFDMLENVTYDTPRYKIRYKDLS